VAAGVDRLAVGRVARGGRAERHGQTQGLPAIATFLRTGSEQGAFFMHACSEGVEYVYVDG